VINGINKYERVKEKLNASENERNKDTRE